MISRCCLILLFVWLLSSAAPTTARSDSPAPVDLAAMTLTPADLAAVGWDDLGLASGQTLSVTDLADRAVWPAGAGEEQDAVQDALLGAGWQQGYAATFASLWDPNRTDPGRQVDVEVVAYADAPGAAQGFALVPDVYATGPATAVLGTLTIGDESRLTRVAARDPQAGTPSNELALGFRHGRFTARVLLRDWTGDEPTIAAVQALAARLSARIERVVRDGGPELSIHTVQVERRANAVHSEAYVRLDGEDIRSTWESPAELAARVASYGEASDVFTSSTEIAATDSSYSLGFSADLFRFPEEDQAAAWLREAPTRLAQGTDVTAFAIDDGVAEIGDEAIAVTLVSDPDRDGMEVNHTSAVLFRGGAVVAEIRLKRLYDPPSMSATKELAAAQAACLATTSCLRSPPVPVSLNGAQAGDTEESPTPAQISWLTKGRWRVQLLRSSSSMRGIGLESTRSHSNVSQ